MLLTDCILPINFECLPFKSLLLSYLLSTEMSAKKVYMYIANLYTTTAVKFLALEQHNNSEIHLATRHHPLVQ